VGRLNSQGLTPARATLFVIIALREVPTPTLLSSYNSPSLNHGIGCREGGQYTCGVGL
jgi:hypothetical protein